MKRDTIESLIKALIKEKDFMPLEDENGNLLLSDRINVLFKNASGTVVIVELIDGDRLSVEEINERLIDNGKRLLKLGKETSHYIFELFVFDKETEKEKLEAISNHQMNKLIEKKYIKCLTVNLSNKNIVRHSNTAYPNMGIEGLVRKQLEPYGANIYKNESLEEIIDSKKKEFYIETKAKIPYITYGLIIINILVWAAISIYALREGVTYSELLVSFGAKENLHIISGEYWRFFTPIFLHANLIHLALNCYSLYAIGMITERIFGHMSFILVYLFSGIVGNIASFAFLTSSGVGASGAIFGLMGLMLYFGLEKTTAFKAYFSTNITIVIITNLVYGFSKSGIDNFAHIGGLLGGFLIAGVISKSQKKKWYTNRIIYLVLTVLITVSLIYYGFNNKQNKIVTLMQKIQINEKLDNFSEIENISENILKLNPSDANVKASILWTVARAEGILGKYSEAEVHAKELQDLKPKDGHYLLGLIYFDIKQYSKAKEELLEAKKLKAEYSNIDELLSKIDSIINKGN